MCGMGLIPGGSKEGSFGLGSREKRNLLFRKSGSPQETAQPCPGSGRELEQMSLEKKKRSRSPCFSSLESSTNMRLMPIPET